MSIPAKQSVEGVPEENVIVHEVVTEEHMIISFTANYCLVGNYVAADILCGELLPSHSRSSFASSKFALSKMFIHNRQKVNGI